MLSVAVVRGFGKGANGARTVFKTCDLTKYIYTQPHDHCISQLEHMNLNLKSRKTLRLQLERMKSF